MSQVLYTVDRGKIEFARQQFTKCAVWHINPCREGFAEVIPYSYVRHEFAAAYTAVKDMRDFPAELNSCYLEMLDDNLRQFSGLKDYNALDDQGKRLAEHLFWRAAGIAYEGDIREFTVRLVQGRDFWLAIYPPDFVEAGPELLWYDRAMSRWNYRVSGPNNQYWHSLEDGEDFSFRSK